MAVALGESSVDGAAKTLIVRLGKPSWTGYLFNRVSGFEQRQIPRPKVGYRGWDAEGRFKAFYETAPNSGPTVPQTVCVGPIQYTDEGRAKNRRVEFTILE